VLTTPSETAAPGLTRSRPLLSLVVLYAVISLIGWVAWLIMPEAMRQAVRTLVGNDAAGGVLIQGLPREAPPATTTAPLWASSIVSMGSAALLSLPMAWLYTITRKKRGYRQSVVHTLVLLPVVVAGVVVLVKHSLALAFSLAGIVAAVRFRNTLEDSKDAVFIFVATGIGLACGVELSAAATLSVFFNIVNLLLFRTDFGRTPARLEGELAEQRMKRALSMANRTSQFVARLDAEILEQMAPAQLEAIADRAWRRRKETTDEHADDRVRFNSVLLLRTNGSHPARERVEMVLGRHAKRWRFESAESGENGEQRLEYRLKLRKSIEPTYFMDEVRREGGDGILDVELK